MRRSWILPAAGILLLTASSAWFWLDLSASRLALPLPSSGLVDVLAAPPPPERIVLKYEGDVHGFARSSRVYGRLRPETRVPFLALANAEDFASRYVGAAATPTEYALDFQKVLDDPLAAEAFLELASDAAPAGRVYGLCGLSKTDPGRYLRSRAAAAQERRQVRLFVGCSVREASLGEVARGLSVGCGDLGI